MVQKLTILNAVVPLGSCDEEDDEAAACPSSVVLGDCTLLYLILVVGEA